MTLRTIPVERIKLLTCTYILPPQTDKELLERQLIEKATRELVKTLFRHRKVLISERHLPEGVFFHLAVEVIVPEVTYDEVNH